MDHTPAQPPKPHGRRLKDFFLPAPSEQPGLCLPPPLSLHPAEQRLLEHCRTGETLELGELPEEGAVTPSSLKLVRAEFLRFLLLGGDEENPVHEKGVQLIGAFIAGELDLSGCHIKHGVALGYCRFSGALVAQDAKVQGLLTLEGSYLPLGMRADRLQCEGGLSLRNSRVGQQVVLISAQINGDLDCSGGHFKVKKGDALTADRMVVKGSVFLRGDFHAIGTVRLTNAETGGNFDCTDGGFDGNGDYALLAEGMLVNGFVFLKDKFHAIGTVSLMNTNIGVNFECCGGQFEGRGKYALLADGMLVHGCIFLRAGFHASSTVTLRNTEVGSNFECTGGRFDGNGSTALFADGIRVKVTAFLNSGFEAHGLVSIQNGQIGSGLTCEGGRFEAKDGTALSLERSNIEGVCHLRQLPSPVCINAGYLKVAMLNDEIAAWAHGSVLDGFQYGSFAGSAPTKATDRLAWLRKQSKDHLGETHGAQGFCPQPWRQLQRTLREMGHTQEAREIGIAFEDQLRRIGRIWSFSPGWLGRMLGRVEFVLAGILHGVFGLLSSYGYRPMRLLLWIFLVWFSLGLSYWHLALPAQSAIGPLHQIALQPSEESPAKYPSFSPFVYSLDILLPVVDLSQEKAWGPLVPTPKESISDELGNLSWAHLARLLIWFETLFGWVASLLLVAIVSRFARRTEE